MILIQFVLKNCRRMVILTILAALLSGACNAGLIAMVNVAINHREKTATAVVIAFVALGLGRLLTSFYSQMVSTRFSQSIIAKLRRDLVKGILNAPLRHLEEIGAPKLLVALTDDVYHVTQALLGIALTAVNVAMLIGGAFYLAWLSWKVLLGLTALIALGAIGYRLLMKGAFHSLIQAREEEDKLFRHFRALTEGIKELKLHRERRHEFLSKNIHDATAAYEEHNVAAEKRFTIAQHWSHLLFYALIGIILFLLPTIGNIRPEALTGYVITTLYLMGPLAGVLSSFSLFGRANVSLDKIQRLGISLAERTQETDAPGGKSAPQFERLELLGVTHSYHHERDGSHFVLGPMDLTLRPGELVFIVGGNGSGKSTLGKIITGLYPPEKGEVRLDGQKISDAHRDAYRQNFSAVFADFYLFDTLLGMNGDHLDGDAARYLEALQLNHKVKISGGSFSTLNLSQGQRKRLALLTAYLEDRPLYLFDEWASDQDPQFKEIFYRELLPDLKARGKCVVVITHDDRYFHCADRLVKLDFGQIVYEKDADEALSEDARIVEKETEEEVAV